MEIFSERLKLLRKQRNLTQEKTADNLKLSHRGYRAYEINESSPSLENAMIIADFFNVTIDYLVGRSDEPERR